MQITVCEKHPYGDTYSVEKFIEYYCDDCGDKIDEDVYEVDGDHLCECCLKRKFKLEV